MKYEAHLTVHSPDENEWAKFCIQNNLKPLKFDIWPAPNSPQIMCAYRFDADSLAVANGKLEVLQSLVGGSFDLVRTKLETPLQMYPPKHYEYAECHIKFLIQSSAELLDVLTLAKHGGYGVSEGLWGRAAWLRKFYVTHRLSHDLAWYKFRDFVNAAKTLSPISIEQETVLIDTNPELDGDWCRY